MKVWSVIGLLFTAAIIATIPVSPQVTPRGVELSSRSGAGHHLRAPPTSYPTCLPARLLRCSPVLRCSPADRRWRRPMVPLVVSAATRSLPSRKSHAGFRMCCRGRAGIRSKTMTKDIDVLTALNLDFVASAQNSDVRRFDEILAPEFYCSNPDKSLVDRAAFLEQTAKPVAIKNLQAHDVRSASWAPPPSSTLQPATPRRTGSRRMGDTPIAGRSRTENGSRYRRM